VGKKSQAAPAALVFVYDADSGVFGAFAVEVDSRPAAQRAETSVNSLLGGDFIFGGLTL